MKNVFRGMVAGACLAASSLFFPLQSFADKEVVSNETYSITMKDDYKNETEEKTRIQVSLDSDTDTLYFGVYTQDYNRQDWRGDEKEFLPTPNKHTWINHSNSMIFAFGPSRVKISDIEQSAYLVPRYEWETGLQPYEKDQRTQLLFETMSKAIDKVISKVPFLNKIYDKYIKDAQQKQEDYYDALFANINPDYVRKRIPSYIPKTLLLQSETAREYAIQFDIGNTTDEIPMYLWLKIAEGESSRASYGSPPNRYGVLENVLVKFTLNQNKITRDALYFYFLHGDELNSINVSKNNVKGTGSNPAIITISNMDYEERKQYEEDNVARIGVAEYIIKGDKDSSEVNLSWGIVQFKSTADREGFMTRRKADLKYPLFVKDSVLSYVEKPTLEEILSLTKGFSEQQYNIYGNLILDYRKRTGMEVTLDKDPIKSEKLLNHLENYDGSETN